jgi:hypothetical protein
MGVHAIVAVGSTPAWWLAGEANVASPDLPSDNVALAAAR